MVFICSDVIGQIKKGIPLRTPPATLNPKALNWIAASYECPLFHTAPIPIPQLLNQSIYDMGLLSLTFTGS
jgi:hypothetical protein